MDRLLDLASLEARRGLAELHPIPVAELLIEVANAMSSATERRVEAIESSCRIRVLDEGSVGSPTMPWTNFAEKPRRAPITITQRPMLDWATGCAVKPNDPFKGWPPELREREERRLAEERGNY